MTPAEVDAGRLVVCPTPIGNLQDVTLRVLSALAEADEVACEDTRHTRVLLERHELTTKLVSLHEHNERARASELVGRMRAGSVVALVSDAGTPLVSDPGFALVRECLLEGVPVEVLPGPSAVTTALVASGLPADRWLFVGFLPRKRSELERLLAHAGETLVAFESPRRLAGTLRSLAGLDADRPAAVCRELTKLHEEVRRGGASELADHYEANAARGEIVLVIGAAPAGAASRDVALGALRELQAAGARARPAASVVARLTGVGANELYRALTSEAQRSEGAAGQ
ncbi:MAG TPA: 16S rRNA (cytidine(1402)-2'-O)-methyltransferase [Solirubrobacteraceae bacterium]|jgi:16S rRNA (cytidine1402-2'-O)-methyltransferase|nr:16S rRNA (cytidine(1402)-2'-O)-methyltransferase [Solirubrobacteraceae bacterium]